MNKDINALIRQFLSKSSSFEDVVDAYIQKIEENPNNYAHKLPKCYTLSEVM